MTCTKTTHTSEIYRNLYSYVCERLPLKYMQTRVCRNSYMGTRTVRDSYSCLCERSLTWVVGHASPMYCCYLPGGEAGAKLYCLVTEAHV